MRPSPLTPMAWHGYLLLCGSLASMCTLRLRCLLDEASSILDEDISIHVSLLHKLDNHIGRQVEPRYLQQSCEFGRVKAHHHC